MAAVDAATAAVSSLALLLLLLLLLLRLLQPPLPNSIAMISFFNMLDTYHAPVCASASDVSCAGAGEF